MRVPVSFYERSVEFPIETRTKIEKLLGKDAAKFIKSAQVAAGEYQDIAKAWGTGQTPAMTRMRIEELERLSKNTAAALAALADAEHWFIRQAQALERSSGIVLDDLQLHLQRLASACERAAKFKDLNKGRGNTGDDARRHFIADCARIYRETTGNKPKSSSAGTFAKVVRLALNAAGAKDGLSNDLLKSILKPVR